MSKILLSISLLVSGREDTTEKCLNSIQPLMEQIPCELILVDTGCGADLCKKLKQYTDQIIPFAWCDDFAEARNAGLRKAKGEWFLFLDDDEWFEDVSAIVSFFTSGEYMQYDQAVYKARNYSNLEGTAYSDDWVSRMIKLESDTHFEGKVHESLVPARGKCKQLDAFVHHYGYAFATEEERKEHFERNAALLQKLVGEEPDNLRWRLQILQEYMCIGKGEEMEAEAERSLRLIEKENRPFINLCRGAFAMAMLNGLYLQGKNDMLLAQAEVLRQDARYTDSGICGISYYAAIAAEQLENWELAGQYGMDYCEAWDRYDGTEWEEQDRIITESIGFVNERMTQECRQRMLILCAKALVQLGQAEAFPRAKAEEIMESVQQMMNGNGEFLTLPEDICLLCIEGVLPVEETILALPVSQWMAQVMVLQAKNAPEEWAKVRRLLEGVKNREDIRYDYFAMHDANQLVKQAPTNKTYEELNQNLIYFTESNLSYAGKIYTDEAFSGEMEMLPESCRAAVCTGEYLQAEKDWNEKLEWLGKAAKYDPSIGEFIKALANQIGQEQKRQSEAADLAAKQLKEMAEQVKGQVSLLMSNGMHEEAYSIVQQLRQMVPQDKEVQKLEAELSKWKSENA